MSPIPFITVTGAATPGSHLIVASPALAGSRPGELPHTTLCGQLVVDVVVDQPPGEVECPWCLRRAPRFMDLPSWRLEVHL